MYQSTSNNNVLQHNCFVDAIVCVCMREHSCMYVCRFLSVRCTFSVDSFVITIAVIFVVVVSSKKAHQSKFMVFVVIPVTDNVVCVVVAVAVIVGIDVAVVGMFSTLCGWNSLFYGL